jgi:hypothetical protein
MANNPEAIMESGFMGSQQKIVLLRAFFSQ